MIGLQARLDISVCAVRWGLVREASDSNYGDFVVERALCYRVLRQGCSADFSVFGDCQSSLNGIESVVLFSLRRPTVVTLSVVYT